MQRESTILNRHTSRKKEYHKAHFNGIAVVIKELKTSGIASKHTTLVKKIRLPGIHHLLFYDCHCRLFETVVLCQNGGASGTITHTGLTSPK